LHKSRT